MTTKNKSPLPLPVSGRDGVKAVTVEVDRDLYAVAREEMKRRKMTFRKIVRWALESYLVTNNPREAERLGIKAAC